MNLLESSLHSVPLGCMQLRVETGMHKDGTLQYDLIHLYESFQIFFARIQFS